MIESDEYPTYEEVFQDALENIDRDTLAMILAQAMTDAEQLYISWNLMAPQARYSTVRGIYRALRDITNDEG